MRLNWKFIARCCVCEFVACLLLNLFGCGTAVATGAYGYYYSPLLNTTNVDLEGTHFFGQDYHMSVSFSFAMVVAMGTAFFGHISGAHINPSVTIGCLVIRKIHYVRGLLYLPMQLLGCIAGSALLLAMTPKLKHGEIDVFAPRINDRWEDDRWQSIIWEIILTFMWVLVYLISIRDPKDLAKATSPLLVGFAVLLITMTSLFATRASCNPARALGSAIVANKYDYIWVFLVFSPIGGIIAALVHHFLGYHRYEVEEEFV